MSLTYSLLHPNQVQMIKEKQQSNPLPASESPMAVIQACPQPTNSPLQDISNALVPVSPTEKQHQEAPNVPDFDILDFLCNDNEQDDNELLLATSQFEQQHVPQMVSTVKTKTVVTKKSSPKRAIPTFAGCSIGSIGTINIHIHKH